VSMRWVYAIALLLSSACQAQRLAADTPYINAATELRFPAAVQQLHRIGVQQYPDPRLGVAISYRSGQEHADIFVYDKGLSLIPNGARSPEVWSEFIQSRSNLVRMYNQKPYTNGREIMYTAPAEDTAQLSVLPKASDSASSTSSIGRSEGKVATFHVAMITATKALSTGQEEALSTWVLITGFRHQFAKLIYTYEGVDNEQHEVAQVHLRDFVLSLIAANEGVGNSFLEEVNTP
jgi:hypothetical protein